MVVGIILKSPEFNDSVKEEKVIYADAGYMHANKVGKKTVLAVVGDFDSLSRPPKTEKVLTLEKEKNFTDGERAVLLAKESGAKGVVIYGAFGGKIEHILGNIALLKIADNLGLNAKIKDGNTAVKLLNKSCELTVKKGANFSIIPYGTECKFAKSEGLYYPLDNLTLTNADTRGISNLALREKVYLEIESGECLVIYSENI